MIYLIINRLFSNGSFWDKYRNFHKILSEYIFVLDYMLNAMFPRGLFHIKIIFSGLLVISSNFSAITDPVGGIYSSKLN